MELDLRKLYQATNPSRTLILDNLEDRQYYIDFSEVRGDQIIEELKENITFFSPDKPTCELFTGHIGCGKSTELRRLEAELKQEGFHVVYFESSQDLEMGDVDIGDIMLAIARRVSESLESLDNIKLPPAKRFQEIVQGAARLLQTELELSAEATIPGLGQISASTDGKFSAEAGIPGVGKINASDTEGISLSALGIGKITAKAKNSPELRNKLRDFLEPRTTNILEAINTELIEPGILKLKQQGKKGLVVIVDNLDRVENRTKAWGRPQAEYLFVDRGEQLRQLKCHIIYTMPLSLMFSNDLSQLTNRFGTDPKVLPMVPVKLRDGSECPMGMAKLREMVLARAFPGLDYQTQMTRIHELFDSPETFDDLCRMSGGHVRELLKLLNTWIRKERQLPLSRQGLETVIRETRNQKKLGIDHREWELLRQLQQRQYKQVSGDEEYQVLIRSMFVYEYRDRDGSWFEVNPILLESGKL
ncbi:P-loop NTPase fold protein [Capilliphycus salinus ALCB114379]|uniref:P-loop NTPase fold protein n=1 Tax=Capilliphycus salinus TaxID=2768948 RepID=UPI0039A6C349